MLEFLIFNWLFEKNTKSRGSKFIPAPPKELRELYEKRKQDENNIKR